MADRRKERVQIFFDLAGNPTRTETDTIVSMTDPENDERTFSLRETVIYRYEELSTGQKNSLNAFLSVEDAKVEVQRPLVKAEA
jgi:hypothetical protein